MHYVSLVPRQYCQPPFWFYLFNIQWPTILLVYNAIHTQVHRLAELHMLTQMREG